MEEQDQKSVKVGDKNSVEALGFSSLIRIPFLMLCFFGTWFMLDHCR